MAPPKDAFAAMRAAMVAKGKKKPAPYTRPGQKDAKGRRIDAGKQPGGDPGDQKRPGGGAAFNKRMARVKGVSGSRMDAVNSDSGKT